MIQVVRGPHYKFNEANAGDKLPCIICGKAAETSKTWVHLNIDTEALLPGPESDNAVIAENQLSDYFVDGINITPSLGFWPIGSDCLKQHPELKPYVVR